MKITIFVVCLVLIATVASAAERRHSSRMTISTAAASEVNKLGQQPGWRQLQRQSVIGCRAQRNLAGVR